MIEEIEPAGKNAQDHPCEMKVEIPGDDGEPSRFKKCGILALRQCSACAAWICGTVELDHAIQCVHCGQWFCPPDFYQHRISKDCENNLQAISE